MWISSMTKYVFRREDNGELIEVDWDTMMGQQGGFITLPDGVQARRCTHLENGEAKTTLQKSDAGLHPKIVSDTLGCGQYQVEELREDARRNGFGVEFAPDPAVPEFYQAHVGSVAEWRRYIKHRGLFDKNGRNGGGATLSREQFERAKSRLLEAAG